MRWRAGACGQLGTARGPFAGPALLAGACSPSHRESEYLLLMCPYGTRFVEYQSDSRITENIPSANCFLQKSALRASAEPGGADALVCCRPLAGLPAGGRGRLPRFHVA